MLLAFALFLLDEENKEKMRSRIASAEGRHQMKIYKKKKKKESRCKSTPPAPV
jgi:hypothetical protein